MHAPRDTRPPCRVRKKERFIMELLQELEIINKTDTENDIEHLDKISKLDTILNNKYASIMSVDKSLNRQVVSFQANKKIPFYRWFKYKEGFSADLVINYINKHGFDKTKYILDPFAGSGATLFAASDLGIDSVGIELLPIGQELIKTRNILLNNFSIEDFSRIEYWIINKPWINHKEQNIFNVLKITKGAYSEENSLQIQKYLSCLEIEEAKIQEVLRLALFCVLENISYTRKDGQYLRWDQRSGRCYGTKPFDKGIIKNFNEAIVEKLEEIFSDAKGQNVNSLFDVNNLTNSKGNIQIIGGSCLDELPKMKSNYYDMVITSPPYCNRYDYTRTYALELAMLGIDEEHLSFLRQTMLSCTVENREKDLLSISNKWSHVLNIAKEQELLKAILNYLDFKKQEKTLNNNGLPRMIRGYFYEMSCVIYELYRLLRNNGQVIMVNDNVRYAGASISVDLILSNIAETLGFEVEQISILPIGKGNSSQQMGEHGRESLRKCVYIWRKHD